MYSESIQVNLGKRNTKFWDSKREWQKIWQKSRAKFSITRANEFFLPIGHLQREIWKVKKKFETIQKKRVKYKEILIAQCEWKIKNQKNLTEGAIEYQESKFFGTN